MTSARNNKRLTVKESGETEEMVEAQQPGKYVGKWQRAAGKLKVASKWQRATGLLTSMLGVSSKRSDDKGHSLP